MIVYQNKKNVDLPYRNYLYVEIEIEKSDCTIIDSIINLLFFYIKCTLELKEIELENLIVATIID